MSTASKIEQVFKTANEKVFTIPAGTTVRDAAGKMARKRIGCLVITDDSGMVAGILSERDLLKNVIAKDADPRTVNVEDVMVKNVVSCSLNTSISKAQQIMVQHEIRHLPIIDNSELLGMLSSRDILRYQLSSVKAIVQKQTRVLNKLEKVHPGITSIETDSRGRVVI